MNKIFGTAKRKGEGGEHWMSVSDLMAGLMMVFLFISVSLMQHALSERDKIKDVAKAYEQTQEAIYQALVKEFQKDLKSWGAEIDRNTLSLNFNSPEVLFANGHATLTRKFRSILDDFIPRYLRTLRKYHFSIQEIRIEGHTSSGWNRDSSVNEAYFRNMALSQSRTRVVLNYIMELKSLDNPQRQWVKSNIAAVGYSSSKLILNDNGTENAAKSRRVSFRVITNAEEQIRRILSDDANSENPSHYNLESCMESAMENPHVTDVTSLCTKQLELHNN
ncbi:OmpA-like domain-containing protein [Vibrio rarus]